MTSWMVILALLLLLSAVFGIWWLVQWTAGPRRYFEAGHADPRRDRFPVRERDALAPRTVEEAPGAGDRFDPPIGERAAAVIEGERHGRSTMSTSIDAAARGLIDDMADEPGHGPEPPPWSVGRRRRRRPRRAGRADRSRSGVAPADEPGWGTVRPYARRPGDPRGY
ncbi:hypothetical protein O4J56_23455 [Nocardiopsis sp. RSe5-2]|uniref:Uncharacterized protein n=1 Tax=Nocardiopsis endophytica TaxID=3018445 RepID=A0ABT4UA57_9ACTN|nr:hypothetical protein [Nocardiopsis endophytica]MDA2813621.1 hypothetical protein [Nocardiopsis endophytica]